MGHEVVLTAAFSAGLVVAVSPCATAMLPAYLSYYVTREGTPPANGTSSPSARLSRLTSLGLIGLVGGLAVLAFALVDWVLRFGEVTLGGAALFLGGGLGIALGGFATWEGFRELDAKGRTFLKRQLARGFVVGGAASLGIAAVYLGLGLTLVLAVQLGVGGFQAWLPRIAFISAIAVVILGVMMVLNVGITSIVPGIRAPRGRSVPAFVLFGAGYGLIASGCFFPVFVSVVAAAFTLGPLEASQVLLAYALGSATIFMLVTLSASAAQGAAFRFLRAWRPYVHRIGGLVVIAMGAYILWFDWTYLLSRGL